MGKAKNQEKILRIGIVQGGHIIEERLLRRKATVTVGQSPKNRFMIPSPRVPLSYALIAVRKGQYALCFEKGMLGKVLVGDEVLDLKTLAKTRLADPKENSFMFPLTSESRGKIVLGDVTLLFQFVAPPPEVPKLQLPAEVRGAIWRNADKAMLLTVLLSTFMFGGPIAGLDVWWNTTGRYMAPTKVAQPKLLQTLVSAERTEVEKQKEEENTDKDADRGIDEAKAEAAKAAESTQDSSINEGANVDLGPGEEASLDELVDSAEGAQEGIDMADVSDRVKDSFGAEVERPAGGQMSDQDRLDRAKKLVSNRTVVGIIGTDWGDGDGGFSDFGGSVRRMKDGHAFGEGVLDVGEGGLASSHLDESDGLGALADEMRGGASGPGGFGGPGGQPGNLISIKPEDLGPETGPGSVEVIKGPTKKLEVAKAKVEEKKWKLQLSSGQGFVGGKIDKAEVNKYLRARSSAFQKCFTMVARKNSSVGGKLVLRIKIDLSGRATARVQSDDTGDPALANCIIGKIMEWSFPAPKEKAVEFTIPFVFRTI